MDINWRVHAYFIVTVFFLVLLFDYWFLFYGAGEPVLELYKLLGIELLNGGAVLLALALAVSMGFSLVYFLRMISSSMARSMFSIFLAGLLVWGYSCTHIKFSFFWGDPYTLLSFWVYVFAALLATALLIPSLYYFFVKFGETYIPVSLMIISIGLILLSPLVLGDYSHADQGRLNTSIEPRQPPKGAPNIFYLVVDTLRADHMSTYGYERRKTSPNVTKFSREAVLFERVFSATPWTIPSTASLHSGYHPQVHNAVTNTQKIPFSLVTLAEKLRSEGYQTAAVTAQTYFSRLYQFDQGFEIFKEEFSKPKIYDSRFARMFSKMNSLLGGEGALVQVDYFRLYDFRTPNARDLHETAKRLIEKRLNSSRPFFLNLHYMDPHGPYRPPKDHFGTMDVDLSRENTKKNPTIPATEKNKVRPSIYPYGCTRKYSDRFWKKRRYRYDAEIRYWDEEFGKFMNYLRESGLMSNSIVIVTSDHGEEFYEKCQGGHGSSVFNEQTHIPLIIKTPAMDQSRREERVISHVDLPSTVLELTGVHSGPFQQSYPLTQYLTDTAPVSTGSDTIQTTPVVSSLYGRRDETLLLSLIEDSYKYVNIQTPHGDTQYLYNLDQDFAEENSLTGRRPELTKEMKSKLFEYHETWSDQHMDTQSVELGSGTRKQLKGLGYF